MRSVDSRTRTAASIRPVDADAFFGDELPALFGERGELAAPGARELGVSSFGVEVGPVEVGRAEVGRGDGAGGPGWTLAFDGSRFSVRPGTSSAAAVVRLDAEGLHDLVNDLRTPVGFLTGGDLDMARGRLEDFLDWFVILRSVLDERPAHTAGAVRLLDRDGSDLDLHRAYRIDDDPEDLSHFLAEAGFLHIRGLFDAAEMAAVSSDMDSAAGDYHDGDGNSWWATTDAGGRRLVRMQRFHARSPATAALLADERLLGLGGLTADGHFHGKPGGNDNWCEALIKPIGVVEGISDVPWHKDCSLGSHSYRCSSLTVGISVTGAGPESGQLRVVPGSHRALVWPGFVRRGLDLQPVDLPTATGDVTIHCSCTLHMAQPPVTRERRVLYTDFSLPTDEGARSPNEAAIARIREGAPSTVSQRPSPVRATPD
jgi:Phytanoyl-CoA dioxygenase (PhyH)